MLTIVAKDGHSGLITAGLDSKNGRRHGVVLVPNSRMHRIF